MQLQKGQPKIKIQKYIELSTFKSLNAICFSLKTKKTKTITCQGELEFHRATGDPSTPSRQWRECD